MVEKLNLITVQATGKDGKVKLNPGQVVLWEKHPDHPGGECFISFDEIPREVAETAAVKSAIADGRLTTEVNWNSKAAKKHKKQQEEAKQLDEGTEEEETKDETSPANPFLQKGKRPA